MTVVNSLIYFPQKEIYNSNEYYSARRLSSVIHHCHQACLLGMVPVLAQEIWKEFWNASVHVQVIWMQNDSWNGSKTCETMEQWDKISALNKDFSFCL